MKKISVLFVCFLSLLSTYAAWGQTWPACCVSTVGEKLGAETISCDSSPRSCCARRARRFPFQKVRVLDAQPNSCRSNLFEPYLSSVEVCDAPTTFHEFAGLLGLPLDGLSAGLNLHHTWIRTPHAEAGMGPIKGVLVMTEWQNHSGYGTHPAANCTSIPGCDVGCVENAIELGKPTGLYCAINTCHHAVNRVLRHCGCYDVCIAYSHAGFCTKWAWPLLK